MANISWGAKKKYGIDFLKKYEPWLFDRTTTIFLRYLTTGDLEPYQFALRDAQFYAYHVEKNGNFGINTPWIPTKCHLWQPGGPYDCLVFHGPDQPAKCFRARCKAFEAWNPEYSLERTFWTERHLAFHLMIATAAYEMTGDPALLKRARHAFDIAYGMQTSPPPGAPADGCLIHTGVQHSSTLKGWICSPWMSVLFIDAALRYYLVSADSRVPKSILMLADYMVKTGTYRFFYKDPTSIMYGLITWPARWKKLGFRITIGSIVWTQVKYWPQQYTFHAKKANRGSNTVIYMIS